MLGTVSTCAARGEGTAIGDATLKPSGKPAILFSVPDMGANGVGYDYLRELQKQGFEVDYCDGASPFTWERVKRYNVIVIVGFPPKDEQTPAFFAGQKPSWIKDYMAVLDQFVKAGGGVFLLIENRGTDYVPNEALKAWGLQLPLAVIHDSAMEHLSHFDASDLGSSCAYTDAIVAGPVTEGVKGIWYPIGQHYIGAHTMPVLTDNNWKPMVRMGSTAWTEPPQYDRSSPQPDPEAVIPKEPIKDGTLLAIREFSGGGRMAVMQSWHEFTIGSGMKWLFNNEVLATGLGGRTSDFGRLLVNTYRWLAEPSLKSGSLGGFVTVADRLLEPQLKPTAQENLHESIYKVEEVMGEHHPPVNGKLFRGLIGAETSLSGGQGTVEEFAKAAAAAKLDFVVFLEDLAKLTPEKLKTLEAETRRLSTPTLQLIPGYRMKTDIGVQMFVFGTKEGFPLWPEERLLGGPDKKTFNIQYQDEKGEWAPGNPASDWLLDCSGSEEGNVGFFHFSGVPQGMRMYDAHNYSMAAVRTYEDGKLVEDLTDDYLTTCQSTAVPTPVSVNIVRSPQALAEAVAGRQSLTYAQASSIEAITKDALRWSHQYDGINVFPSDGPLILNWPKEARILTFGSERFVTGRSLNIAPIHVTSEVGLKEISIYNGRDLFRRFLPGGAKDFELTLYLSGIVQRNLVLIATDLKGGRAVSFTQRSFKDGILLPIFCSDHVNVGNMILAHGPNWPRLFYTPVMSDSQAGSTWDGGGEEAQRPLLGPGYATPVLETFAGVFNYSPFNIPLLEFSDETVTRCRSQGGRRMAVEKIRASANPWSGFGPIESDPLFDSYAIATIFNPYVTAVDPTSWGTPGLLGGPIASLFTEELTARQAMTLKRPPLFFQGGWRKKSTGRSVVIAMGHGNEIRQVMDASILPEKTQSWTIGTGDWFAFFSSDVANAHFFINRSAPFRFDLNPADDYWTKFLRPDVKELKSGDTLRFEIFALSWPLDEPIPTARDLADVAGYLANPTGLELKRGTRVDGPGGLLELAADHGAVELSVPKPDIHSLTLPVRVQGFNKRWTVGLYQVEGYRTHYYSKGDSGWTELGLDFEGRAYAPLYVSVSPRTHVLIGHPIVADEAGKDLFIQVTRINDGLEGKPPVWQVSVNNPTDAPVKANLRKAMDLAGLDFADQTVDLKPGEYKVLTPVETAAIVPPNKAER